jgi:hypothetical protein
MAINFPSNPVLNDEYTSGSNTWVWSGITWNLKPPGSNLDDLSDVNVTGVINGQVLFYNSATSNWEATSLTSTFNGGSITNALNIQNSSISSNATSGALIVLGGAGIGGALNTASTATFANALTVSAGGAAISGNSTVTGTLTATAGLTVNTGPVAIRGNNRLRLYDLDNTNFIGLRSPANLTADYTYQLPGADGTSGQVLTTNGSGALSWATVSGGGGGGASNPPGGVTGNIQFNNNGSFGGVSTFNYDVLTDTLQVFDIQLDGNLTGNGTTAVTSISSIQFIDGVAVTKFSDDDTLSTNSNSIVPTEAAVKTYVDNELSLKANINNPTFTGTVNGITKTMVGLGNVENTALSTWTGNTTITSVGTLTNLAVAGNISAPTLPTQKIHATNKQYVDTRAIAMSIAMS